MEYNPYALLDLLVNGKAIHGRPISFDSDIVNQKTMRNAFGQIVKPNKVVTVCPDCGQGLQFDLQLPDPPFGVVNLFCQFCRPTPPPMVDPFVNPLATGRVPVAELDPLLHNPDKPLAEPAGSAADRFVMPPRAQETPSEPSLVPETAVVPSPAVKTKKTQEKAIPDQKAEDVGEERDFPDDLPGDFDDSDLLDD